MKNKKRIGVIVDSLYAPSWAYYVIDRIMKSDFAEIALIVETGSNSLQRCVCPEKNVHGTWRNRILSAYFKLDAYFNTVDLNAFEPKHLMPLIEFIPFMKINPTELQSLVGLDNNVCEKIAEYSLDILLPFGGRIPAWLFKALASDGIWLYQHGSGDGFSKQYACFQEIVNENRESLAVLKAVSQTAEPEVVLCDDYAQTNTLSVFRYNNINHWKTATNLLRQIKKLYQEGSTAFFTEVNLKKQNQPSQAKTSLHNAQNSNRWLLMLLKLLIAVARKQLRHFFFFDQYFLLYQAGNKPILPINPAGFTHLVPPVDRFWADPFVVCENDQYYIFIEEVQGSGNKGHISCLQIDQVGTVSAVQMVIKEPYHMSYPFVFRYEQQYYMIPETAENRTINLYRCHDFPHHWEKESVLLENVRANDTTLYYHDGLWWMFVTICEYLGTPSNDELHIFYSNDLFAKQWTPHPQNPVVCDVSSARPAGKIFEQNGVLYRPSQNCKQRYGYAVKINRIETLSTTQYQEQCVDEIAPVWDEDIVAVHTLNQTAGLVIIDGVLKRARPFQDYFRYLGKFKRKILLMISQKKAGEPQ